MAIEMTILGKMVGGELDTSQGTNGIWEKGSTYRIQVSGWISVVDYIKANTNQIGFHIPREQKIRFNKYNISFQYNELFQSIDALNTSYAREAIETVKSNLTDIVTDWTGDRLSTVTLVSSEITDEQTYDQIMIYEYNPSNKLYAYRKIQTVTSIYDITIRNTSNIQLGNYYLATWNYTTPEGDDESGDISETLQEYYKDTYLYTYGLGTGTDWILYSDYKYDADLIDLNHYYFNYTPSDLDYLTVLIVGEGEGDGDWEDADLAATEQNIKTIAVIPNASGEDEVWLGADRQINSTNHLYIERMAPRVYDYAWFVDCGIEYDSTETTTITGADHLEGEQIIVLADGVEVHRTVVNGSFSLDTAAAHIIYGLSNVYKLQPMRFDISIDGTTKGTLKRFAELVVSFLKSLDVQYGIDMNSLYDVPFEDIDAENTGDVVLNIDGGFSVEDPIIITGSGPFPCIVRAMIPRLEEVGR